MKLHDFALNDGTKLSVGQDGEGVHMLVEDQHLAGPFDPDLARSRVTVPLPGQQGSVGVHIAHDGRFEVFHDGQAIPRWGLKKPKNKRVDRARKLLVFLGVLNYLAFLAFESSDTYLFDTKPFLYQALGLLFLALFAYVWPDLAWISLGLAAVFVAVSAVAQVVAYRALAPGTIISIFYLSILSKGFSAAWVERIADRRPT